MSALNWTERGALPSSLSTSAQARRGAPSSSSPCCACGAVLGVADGVVAAGVFGASAPFSPPPPQARARVRRARVVADRASRRIMMPPRSVSFRMLGRRRKRRRILTEASVAVNSLCGLILVLLALDARALGKEPPHTGVLRLLVIRAAFPDRPLARSRAEIGSLLERFEAYYREVSAGRLRIRARLAHTRVVLPSPRLRYVQGPGVMAADAIRALVATAHPRDRMALDRADAVLVFFAGPGKESHAADADQSDPWSNFTTLPGPVQGFDRACVIAERELDPFDNFGVLCHEFGHLLGLPELYATGGRPQEGIGLWGLMGHGTWLEKGAAPPHLEAWSKMQLGWVDVREIDTTTRGVELPAVEEDPQVVRIPAVPGRRPQG